MSKIVLGQAAGHDVKLDVDLLLRTRMLVQANSGKGKSWLLRRLAEQLLGKVQVIILDPEGEFATLREKFDYVLVGKGGETAAHPRIAAMTAQRLLEIRACAVIDLYEMKPSERHSYVRLFLDSLIDAPKNLWHPVVIILDEAHVYCPEKGAGESEASDAVINCATRGRKRGYCLIPATQRLGKFRKDAAAEMLNVAIGGTFIDIDRKRAADALGVYGTDTHKFFDEIRLLERGSFYFLGPAVSDQRILVKVGRVETTHPEAGSSKHAAEPPPAPDKVKALLPKLADLPKEAEEKAKTIAEFQKLVRELQQKLHSAQTAQPALAKVAGPSHASLREQSKIVVALKAGLEEAMKVIAKINAKGFDAPGISQEEITAALQKASAEIVRIAKQKLAQRDQEWETLKKDTQRTLAKLQRLVKSGGELNIQVDLVKNEPTTVRPSSPPRLVPRDGAGSNGSLPVGERSLLIAVAQYPEGAERDQLSILTGYKRSSRDAYISRLLAKGYLSAVGRAITATQEGIDALGSSYEPLPTGDALREYWLGRLPEGERKILEVLIEQSGNPIDRDSLDERTGYKRSSRDAYLSRLAARRLVDVSGRGMVAASAGLFN
ncbi:MAG: helicase HerA domain-containing protein [Terriglobales bacterium]